MPGDHIRGISSLRSPEDQGLAKETVTPSESPDRPQTFEEAESKLSQIAAAMEAQEAAVEKAAPHAEDFDVTDRDTFDQILALAEKESEVPDYNQLLKQLQNPEPTQEPTAEPQTQEPTKQAEAKPSEFERMLQVIQEQNSVQMQAMQQQNQMFQQQLQQLMQAQTAPMQRQSQDELRVQQMQSARLDPTNPHHVFMYEMWNRNQRLEQTLNERVQQIESQFGQVYTQANQIVREQEIDREINANLSKFKNVPEITKKAIRDSAILHSQNQDPKEAVKAALSGFVPVLSQLAQTVPPQPSTKPPAPAQQPVDPLAAMRAVAASGNTGGRAKTGKPLTLADFEKNFFN